MAEVVFDRAFFRQVGGIPPPPALGTDVVPANVAGVGALDNGVVLPTRTIDYSLGAVVVGVASAVAATVTVEVYVGDELRNTWLLAGAQAIPTGQVRRFPIPAGPGTTSIPVFVRPLAAGVPAGTYQFLFGGDQATRPFPEGSLVTVTGAVVIPDPANVNVVGWFGSAAPTVGRKAAAASVPVVLATDQAMPAGTPGTTPARAASQVVKAAPGTLWEIYANSNSLVNIWLMTFDAAAVPANGTAPLDFVQIPRTGLGEAGICVAREHAVGIVWAASTTPDTLTIAGAVLLTRTRFV